MTASVKPRRSANEDSECLFRADRANETATAGRGNGFSGRDQQLPAAVQGQNSQMHFEVHRQATYARGTIRLAR